MNIFIYKNQIEGAEDKLQLPKTKESPEWTCGTREVELLGPYVQDWKAYWIPAHNLELEEDFNQWLLDKEADGTLKKLKEQHLGITGESSTTKPLSAIIININERLSHMPTAAIIKYNKDLPVEVLEQGKKALE